MEEALKMENKLLEEREECYEEEISLYDILDILKKYKKKILQIIGIGILLSFGLALIARQFRKEVAVREYKLNYDILEKDSYFAMTGVIFEKFDSDNILEDEKYIDRFLEIPALKTVYDAKNFKNEREELARKRKFIKKIIKITPPNEKNSYYTVTISLRKGKEAIPEMMNTYFTILEEEIPKKIKTLLLKTREFALKKNAEANTKLLEVKEKLNTAIDSRAGIANSIAETNFLISVKNPILVVNKSVYQGEYEKTLNQIVGVDALFEKSALRNLIETKGSVASEAEKSNAPLVLLAGIILSFAIAFFYVLFHEFLEGYSKHKGEQKLLEKR